MYRRMNGTKVTIITVCLNAEKTIERTIKSIINQTYSEIEYIIVDGLSTDRTMDIVYEYQDYIDLIISEKDKGLYYAMNKGIEKSTGDIIGIINADDWYEAHAVETAVNALNKSMADIAVGRINVIDDNNRISEPAKRNLYYIWSGMTVDHPALFVKKQIYNEYGLFNCSYSIVADYEFVYRLLKIGVSIVYVNRVLATFSLGGLSNSQNNRTQNELNTIMKGLFDLEMLQERIKQKLQYATSVYIWGAGYWGQILSSILGQHISVTAVIDSDTNKWGNKINNIEICGPDYLNKRSGMILIATEKGRGNIIEQINRMNSNLQYIELNEIIDDITSYFEKRNTISYFEN